MVDRKEWAVPESRSTKKKRTVKWYGSKNNIGAWKYRRKYALTAKQKMILKQFDMDEKYIDRSIGEFSY